MATRTPGEQRTRVDIVQETMAERSLLYDRGSPKVPFLLPHETATNLNAPTLLGKGVRQSEKAATELSLGSPSPSRDVRPTRCSQTQELIFDNVARWGKGGAALGFHPVPARVVRKAPFAAANSASISELTTLYGVPLHRIGSFEHGTLDLSN